MTEPMAYRFNQRAIQVFMQDCLKVVDTDGCDNFEEMQERLNCFCNVFVLEIVVGYPWNWLSTLSVSG